MMYLRQKNTCRCELPWLMTLYNAVVLSLKFPFSGDTYIHQKTERVKEAARSWNFRSVEGMTSDASLCTFLWQEFLPTPPPSDSLASGMACHQILLHSFTSREATVLTLALRYAACELLDLFCIPV